MENHTEARAWLAKWDAGEIVWTIEMGGLGPGYEQCIQLMAAEMLRVLLERGMPEDDEARRKLLTELPAVEKLGPTGAQWGAAANLAMNFYRRGPEVALASVSPDRRIPCQRTFPQL